MRYRRPRPITWPHYVPFLLQSVHEFVRAALFIKSVRRESSLGTGREAQ